MSLALRYWNLAQQRHCRQKAPYRRPIPVSADRAPSHGPHTRAKRGGSQPRRATSRERRTVRWREMDSNFRFRVPSPASAACRRRSIICGCRRRTSATAGQNEISEPKPYRARNRKFESISLQRRVRYEFDFPPREPGPTRVSFWRACARFPPPCAEVSRAVQAAIEATTHIAALSTATGTMRSGLRPGRRRRRPAQSRRLRNRSVSRSPGPTAARGC